MATKAERTAEIQERIAARVTPKQRKEAEKQRDIEANAGRIEAARIAKEKHARDVVIFHRRCRNVDWNSVAEMDEEARRLGITEY